MTVACHLVATGKDVAQLEHFVERLQQDLMFMGYKPPTRPPEVEQRAHDYMVVIGSIVRKDGMT